MVTGLMDSITPSFVINSPEGIGRKHWTRYIWTICLPARSMAGRGVHIPQGDRMRYEVYLMITTRDGMRYVTPDNPIASFSSYEGGREIREPCGRFSVDTPWHPYSGPQTHPGKGKSM